MNWEDIRQVYPDQWLIIEALEARTSADQQRLLDKIAVIERCAEGASAFGRYRQLHQQHPQREFYYVHTSRPNLDIREVQWLGVRRNHAAGIER
jgi:hypothetical protein